MKNRRDRSEKNIKKRGLRQEKNDIISGLRFC